MSMTLGEYCMVCVSILCIGVNPAHAKTKRGSLLKKVGHPFDQDVHF